MDLARQIELVLAVTRSAPVGAGADLRDDVVSSLAALGFPGLSSATIFLTSAGVELIERESAVLFPARCCVCGAPATQHLAPALPARLFGRLRPGPLSACVPHCDVHATGRAARLLVTRGGWSRETTYVNVIGFDRDFLDETAQLNRRGDAFPPWRAFPDVAPESSAWRQGNAEHWWDRGWRPFWAALSAGERDGYLTRWSAPAEWRERLGSTGSAGPIAG